jgi:hypothetical protein
MAETESIIPRPPLSPVRAELAACIDQLAAAQREAEVAAGPANRLHQVVSQLAAAENELAELRAVDNQVLGEWLASGAENARPQPSPATLEAEKKLAQLTRRRRRSAPGAAAGGTCAPGRGRAAHRSRRGAPGCRFPRRAGTGASEPDGPDRP